MVPFQTGQTEAVRVLTVAMQATAGQAGPAFRILYSARVYLENTDPDRRALTGPEAGPVWYWCPVHGRIGADQTDHERTDDAGRVCVSCWAPVAPDVLDARD